MFNLCFKKSCIALSLTLASLQANAQSITLDFNYMATNLKGDFSTASGGSAVSVASLKLDDFSDGENSGVRATFNVNANGLSQFSTGIGSVYISAFELNFPHTALANGYDSNANGGLGNNWQYVSSVELAGGVEWQEGGANNGWGIADETNSFGQEYNWGNGTNFAGLLTQINGASTIDLFNVVGQSNISVANLLTNAVENIDSNLPDALAWIKIRSNRGNPANRGLLANGWWGDSAQNNGTATGRYSLDVLATSYTVNPVPVPAALPLMASALGLFGFSRRRQFSFS